MLPLPSRGALAQRLGRVADFCPICRRTTAMTLYRLSRAWQVEGVALGRGETTGHARRCTTCGMEYLADPQAYIAVNVDREASLDALVATTFPDLAQAHAARLDLEGRLLIDPDLLEAHERAALIDEPFELLDPYVQAVENRKVNAAGTWSAPVVLFGGPIVALAVVARIAPGNGRAMLWGVLASVVLGIAAAVFVGYRLHRRFLRRRIFPRIAATLRPLEPSSAEITAAMARVHARGRAIGKPRFVRGMLAALDRPRTGA